MPKDANKAAIKELKRLKKMPQQMPEHAMIRYEKQTMVYRGRANVYMYDVQNMWC